MHKIFCCPNFSETPKGSPTRFCGTTIFRRKIVIIPSFRPLSSINFFDTRNCLKHRRVYTIFGTVRQQFFDGKSWYSLPLPPLVHKVFRYQNFSETPKGSLWPSVLRRKKNRRKSWCPPLSLLSSTFLVTRNTSLPLRRFSVVWDKVFLMENRNTPPAPRMHKFFRYLKFSETQDFPYEVFRYWERQKNRPKVAMPLLSL